MNTSYTQSLLSLYNKNSPYKRSSQPRQTDGVRLGTWAYANEYDYLYDQYSQNKNFNAEMWRDAIKYGAQDAYLALIEKNKDNTLSDKFYDPQYYDYEAMMTELYLPFADNTKLEKYTREVFNPTTGKMETEDIGEMTQRQYLEYTLKNSRLVQQNEIRRTLEQEKKDALGLWGQLGADTMATLAELGEGVLGIVAGTVDILGGLGYATFNQQEGETWDEAFVRYFGEEGLTALEKNTIRRSIDEWERRYTHFRDIDGNMTNAGQFFAGVANSIGMMLPSILLVIPTGGTSLAFLPQVTFYAGIFGNNMYENATNEALIDTPAYSKILNAGVKTVAEAVIEKVLGKVLGGTIQNNLFNIGGKVSVKGFDNTWRGATRFALKSAGQEGLEEFLQDFGTACVDAFMGARWEGYGRDGINLQTLVDSFVMGALSSLVLGGSQVGLRAIDSKVSNKRLAGSGDVVLEMDGKLKKVTGFNRLYYSQILSDFKENLEELKKGKFGTEKNFALARDTYTALSAISQYYSSFDQSRIKNCEMLLDRVVKEETKANEFPLKAKEYGMELSKSMESAFNDMYTGAQNRHLLESKIEHDKKAAEKALKKAEHKLKEGGVTEVKTASSVDNENIKRNPDGTIDIDRRSEETKRLEDAIGKKAVDRLTELHKYYKHVCTTDGHVAIEEDDFLFVSEGWLKNYSVDEIFDFMRQAYIFDTIGNDVDFAPLIKDLKNLFNTFSGSDISGWNESAQTEHVLMHFLFNSSFYQAFILSDGGRNLHKYEKLLFSIYRAVRSEGKSWLELRKDDDAPEFAKEKNTFARMNREIKKAWRDPTMKAIINWNLEPQALGADSVLNERDLEFINRIQDRRRILNNFGGSSADRSAHRHLREQIVESTGRYLTPEELAVIERAEQPGASAIDKVQALVILDREDMAISYGGSLAYLKSNIQYLRNWLYAAEVNSDSSFEELHYEIFDFPERVTPLLSSDEQNSFESLINKYKKKFGNKDPDRIPESQRNEFVRDILKLLTPVYDKYTDISSIAHNPANGAYIIPHDAAELALGGDLSGAQQVADAINEFTKQYGTPPEAMLKGNFAASSQEQIAKLRGDMASMGIDDLFFFIQTRLENMLGNDYVIVPRSFTSPRNGFSTSAMSYYVQAKEDLKNFFKDSSGWNTIEDVENFDSFLTNTFGFMSEIDPLFEAYPDFKAKWKTFDTEFDNRLKPLVFDKTRRAVFNFYHWLKTQEPLLSQMISMRIGIERSAARNSVEDLYRTDFTNMVICRKLPASMILPSALLDAELDAMEQKKIITDIFVSLDRPIVQTELDALKDRLKDYAKKGPVEEARAEAWSQTIEFDPQDFVTKLAEGYDPTTGEIFFQDDIANGHDINKAIKLNDVYELVEPLFKAITERKLSDVINVSNFNDPGLTALVNRYTIKLIPLRGGYGGWQSTDREEIVMRADRRDLFDILVHEVNHMFESFYLRQYGLHHTFAKHNPKLLAHIANNYPILVNYMRRTEYSFNDKYEAGKVTEDWVVNESSPEFRRCLEWVIYYMGQGEIWARGSVHNQRTRGITMVENKIVAPDGTTFVTNYNNIPYKHADRSSFVDSGKIEESVGKIEAPTITPAMDDSLSKAFARAWRLHTLATTNLQSLEHYTHTRNTYHTRMLRDSTIILESLINPLLPSLFRYKVTLNDVITNPKYYLKPELKEQLDGDFSEGNVLYMLRNYLEERGDELREEQMDAGEDYEPSISIGITRDFKYVFVDDNQFNELLTEEMLDASYNTEATLIKEKKLLSKTGIPLSTFYDEEILYNLGLSDVKIVIDPNVKTEAIWDDENRDGKIFIQATEKMPDDDLIDKVNHEFRHILQLREGFQPGFTPSIKVTPEMIADMKKNVPGVFKDPVVREKAEKYREKDNIKGETLEQTIVRYTIYFMNAGEQEAYGLNSTFLSAKPVLVDKFGGRLDIYMPWANPNGGVYHTGYLENRAIDSKNGPDAPLVLSKFDVEVKPARGKDEPLPKGARKLTEAQMQLPRHQKGKKFDERKTITTPEGLIETVYKYDEKRQITKKRAEGTNLMYFYHVGEPSRNQMDPKLQEFVIDSTGHLDELYHPIAGAIRDGILTKQSLFKLFKNAEPEDINQYTFDLLKTHFFPETPFSNMQEVVRFVNVDIAIYWAAVPYLYQTFKSTDGVLREMTIDHFIHYMDIIKNSDVYHKIQDRIADFYRVRLVADENGGKVDLVPTSVFDEKKYKEDVEKLKERAKKKGTKYKAPDKKAAQYWKLEYVAKPADIGGLIDTKDLRILALQDFDGSLAGAFHVAWNARRTAAWMARDQWVESLDKGKDTDRGKGTSGVDRLKDRDADIEIKEDDEAPAWGSADDAYADQGDDGDSDDVSGLKGKHKARNDAIGIADRDSAGNDLLAIYTSPMSVPTSNGATFTEMLETVTKYLLDERFKEIDPEYENMDADTKAKFAKTNKSVLVELMPLLQDKTYIEDMYADIQTALATDQVASFVRDRDGFIRDADYIHNKSRVNIQKRMKSKGDKIAAAIRDGYISFEELPSEARVMFKKVEVALPKKTTKTGEISKNATSKIETYVLDEQFYEVGKGRKALPGERDTHHVKYNLKRGLRESTMDYRHDVSEILKNDEILLNTWNSIKKEVRKRKKAAAKGEVPVRTPVKNLYAGEKRRIELFESLLEADKVQIKDLKTQIKEASRPVVNINYTVKGTGDGKAVHEELKLVSLVEGKEPIVPNFLKEVLSTTFTYSADTKVQWASVDENGEFFKKDKDDFESLRQHEINDWEKFLDLNTATLMNITRDDVIDAVNSLYLLAPTDPAKYGKYNVFRVFLYGFFYATAKDNSLGWNFSDAEIDLLRRRYEDVASGAGSTLNAVKQMLPVIKPLIIGARMFRDWDTVSEQEAEDFTKKVEEMQQEKDLKKQKELAAGLVAELKALASREIDYEKARTSKAKKVWNMVKKYRYLAMLSGPGTWVRNKISNVTLRELNRFSDTIGDFVFRKRDYRDEQWDLRNVQVTAEVKDFTNTYIENNPAFEHVYELSGKRDTVHRIKAKDGDAAIFTAIVTEAYRRHYAVENSHFISKFIHNRLSDEKFIKFAAQKYFNKMLTIEVAKGNIKLDGLNGQILHLFADAIILANEDYMHKQAPLGYMLNSDFRDRFPKAYEAINFLFPFLNSSFNWFTEEFIGLTPLGLARSIGRMIKFEKRINDLEDRRRRGERVTPSRAEEFLIRRGIGKGIVGTTFLFLGALLCGIGWLGIDDDDEDKIMLKVGNNIRMDITNIFGTSSLLIGASLVQAWTIDDERDVAQRIEMMAGHLTDSLLSGFFLADVMDRHRYDDNNFGFITTELNSALSSFVPQFVQLFVDGLNEQKIKYSSGMKGNWEYWLNRWVPTQPMGHDVINVYTGETEDRNSLPFIGGGLFRKGILGPKIYWVEVGEGEELCRTYDSNHAELTGEITVDGQKKKLDQTSLNKKYGELNKASLAKVTSQKHYVQMPNGKYQTLHWDKLSDKQRKNVLSRVFTDNADIAKIYVWTQVMGNKYYGSSSQWKELKALGITRNIYKGDKGFVE